MRYRLRTLLIVLAIGPPFAGLAFPAIWREYSAWRAERMHRYQVSRIKPAQGGLRLSLEDITTNRPIPPAKRLPTSDD